MSENERVALVTGGGRGIGLGIVEKLVADGFRVVVNDVDPEPVAELEQRHSTIKGAVGSIRDRDFPEFFLQTALDTFGRVDVVVNNAGYATYGSVDEIEPEDWDRVLDVLVSAPFRIMRPIGQYFRKTAGETEISRRVVNISSIAALGGSPNQAAYGAGKAAIINLSSTWALELAPFNVRSNAICPGLIDTRLTRAGVGDVMQIDGKEIPLMNFAFDDMVAKIPVGRAGSPGDIAGAVSLLVRPEADYITGQAIRVDGGVRGF